MSPLLPDEPGARARIRLCYPVALIALLWLAWLGDVALVTAWDRPYHFGPSLGSDYVVYFAAGASVWDGRGNELYDAARQKPRQERAAGRRISGQLLYHRPPWYAALFAPLSRVPFRASYAIWCALGVAALGASLRLLGAPSARAFGWSLAWPPVFFAFAFGQTILLNLLLLCAFFALWRRGALLPAGLVLALLGDKPHLLAGVGLLLLLEWRREWPTLAACAVGCAVLAAASWAISPLACADYASALFRRALPSAFTASNAAKVHSVASFLHLALPVTGGVANVLAAAAGTLALGGFVAFWRRQRARPELCFAAAVVLPFLSVPYALVYDYALLLVPAVVLPRFLPDESWRWGYALLGAAAFLALPAVSLQLEHLPFAIAPLVPALAVVSADFCWRLRATRTARASSPRLRPFPVAAPD